MKFVAVSALIAAASGQIGTFDQDGYMDLPAVPGMDFVGFGYDVRYIDDTNQGLRLPMMEFTFAEKKTYRYPLYKDRMYRVPDELFVRTVGTATAENYQFSNIEEYKENWAAKLGLTYTKNTGEPIAPEKVNTTNGASGEATNFNSSATPDTNNTNAPTQGYGDIMPSSYLNKESAMFEVGVDFQFKKRMTKDITQIQVHNIQSHQLYQLMVNKNKIRTHMQADINVLKVKQFQVEPEAYRAFFEKYGTHYVQTAMLGGAIELSSVTSNIAETDFLRVEVNLSVVSNSSSSGTEVTGNNTERLIAKSSNCTGKYFGWSWNTFLEKCVTPYELECYKEMPKEDYEEKFDYIIDDAAAKNFIPLGFNHEKRKDAYKAFPWRRGPGGVAVRDCQKNENKTTTCDFPVPSWFYFTTTNTMNTGRENTLVVDAFSQSASGATGISRLIKWGQPQLIQWDQYSVQTGVNTVDPGRSDQAYGNVGTVTAFSYEGDQYTHQDDKVMWSMEYRGLGNATHNAIVANRGAGGKSHRVPKGEWVSYKLIIDWQTYKTDLWFKGTSSGAEWTYSNLNDVPFQNQATGLDRMDIFHVTPKSGRTFFDSMKWCNAAGGAKYAPVSKSAAIQKAGSNMKQTITGNLDFSFETKNTNKDIKETSNYKVKGGDTSIVDLLNLRAKGETFKNWKASIPTNPAPVTFSLREISSLFSKDPVVISEDPNFANKRQTLEAVTVIPRDEMRKATAAFLTTVEEGEIIYPRAADMPPGFDFPLGA